MCIRDRSLSILLNIFSLGVNSAGVAEDYNVAVQLAESLMAKTGVEMPLQVGETVGDEQDKYIGKLPFKRFNLIPISSTPPF